MAEYDFFDLTKLPFDPPDEDEKTVIDAIEIALRGFKGRLGSISQQQERTEVNALISFLETKKKELFTNTNLNATVFKRLARERTKIEINKLRAVLDERIKSGETIANQTTIKGQAKVFNRLSEENVKKTFQDAGFDVVKIDPFESMPKFPTNAEIIYKKLETLRKAKDPKRGDLEQVTDLYALTAFLEGEVKKVGAYRTKAHTDIFIILEKHAKALSLSKADLEKEYADLVSKGRLNIFDSREHRDAYDLHLLYKSKGMQELFEKIKGNSPSVLTEPKNADRFISQIESVFKDYDIALAIYNHVAKPVLKDDPGPYYGNEIVKFSVICPHYGHLVKFNNQDEAELINKCPQCGKDLYRKCKKCNHLMLISVNPCPKCGYDFSRVSLFCGYIDLAYKELKDGKIDKAERLYEEAYLADPDQKTQLLTLKQKIDEIKSKYKKPLVELQQLIKNKNIPDALKSLERFKNSFPTINVEREETQIQSLIQQSNDFSKNLELINSALRRDDIKEAEHHLALARAIDSERKAELSSLEQKIETAKNNLKNKEFDHLLAIAKNALNNNNFQEAERQIIEIKSKFHEKTKQIADFHKQIFDKKSEYAKQLDDLRQLIKNKNIPDALKSLERFKNSFPTINVEREETQIQSLNKQSIDFIQSIELGKGALRRNEINVAERHLADARVIAPERKAELSSLEQKIEIAKNKECEHLVAQAKNSLNNKDFQGMERQINEFKRIFPEKTEIYSDLQKMLSDKKENLFAELRVLITAKKLQTASEKVKQFEITYKGLDTEPYKKLIEPELMRAQKMFDADMAKNVIDRANGSIDILEKICVDFEPAKDFLGENAPREPQNLKEEKDVINCRVNIKWEHSGEKGVTYRVLRKWGNEIPEILKQDITDLVYTDETAEPGKNYVYGVCAKRAGRTSSIAWKEVVVLAEVAYAPPDKNGTKVHLSWIRPKNCTGVTIIKSVGGKQTTLATNAQDFFEDSGLEYRQLYDYILKANYRGFPSSEGVTISVTPEERIDPFSINVKKATGNKYIVKWDIPTPNTALQILVNDKVEKKVSANVRHCEINLAPNGYYSVSARASSGSNWVSSTNAEPVNTFRACEIDSDATTLIEDTISNRVTIRIKLSGDIPQNAEKLLCDVISENPLDTDNNKIRLYSTADEYRKKGYIEYNEPAGGEDTYYISLVTVFKIGEKEIPSAAAELKIPRPLIIEGDCNILKNRNLFASKRKLSIRIKSNRLMSMRPPLLIKARNKSPNSYENTAIDVLRIPEEKLSNSVKELTYKGEEIDTKINGKPLSDWILEMYSGDENADYICTIAQ